MYDKSIKLALASSLLPCDTLRKKAAFINLDTAAIAVKNLHSINHLLDSFSYMMNSDKK